MDLYLRDLLHMLDEGSEVAKVAAAISTVMNNASKGALRKTRTHL